MESLKTLAAQKLSSFPTLAQARKLLQRAFDSRLLKQAMKSTILSTVFFAAILFFVADSLVSSFSANNDMLPSMKTQQLIQTDSSSTYVIPFSTPPHEEIDELSIEEENSLIPPFGSTREQRLAWFRQKLPTIEIMNYNKLTEQFHGRVLEFLKNDCSVQFFMVWNSPARSFRTRDFLTIDSLFNANPRGCLIIVSRTMDSRRGYSILKPLLDRGFKILAVTPDVPFLAQNTPAETWFEQLRTGRQDPGGYFMQNLADLIKFSVLYKYGGVYLDTDFIVLKDFSGLRNSIGAQSLQNDTKDWLNGAAMAFDIYHPLLDMFLEEFASTYNGNRWGHNGPHLMSRVIQRLASVEDSDFKILPPEAFYPVDWVKIERMFQKPATEEEWRWVQEQLFLLNTGGSYGLHMWNRHTSQLKIEEGSVMGKLISAHCIVCENIHT